MRRLIAYLSIASVIGCALFIIYALLTAIPEPPEPVCRLEADSKAYWREVCR